MLAACIVCSYRSTAVFLSPTHFELMMDKLEKGSGNTVLSEREAQGLLRDDENLVLAVYDYWLAKRLRLVCEV